MEDYFQQKDIPGYDGWYQATTDGRIWSCKTGKFLSPAVTSNGYLYVMLSGRKHEKVARLVALTWIKNSRDDATEVDHIDRNPSNNQAENLRWLTKSENNHNQNRKGYWWDKRNKNWYSQITVNGKRINIGRFNTEQEASKAFCDASRKYFPGIRMDLPF